MQNDFIKQIKYIIQHQMSVFIYFLWINLWNSHLSVFQDNYDTQEAKKFFQDNYSHIYYIFYDNFGSVEADLKQRGMTLFKVLKHHHKKT